jgi:hypothetical protein
VYLRSYGDENYKRYTQATVKYGCQRMPTLALLRFKHAHQLDAILLEEKYKCGKHDTESEAPNKDECIFTGREASGIRWGKSIVNNWTKTKMRFRLKISRFAYED